MKLKGFQYISAPVLAFKSAGNSCNIRKKQSHFSKRKFIYNKIIHFSNLRTCLRIDRSASHIDHEKIPLFQGCLIFRKDRPAFFTAKTHRMFLCQKCSQPGICRIHFIAKDNAAIFLNPFPCQYHKMDSRVFRQPINDIIRQTMQPPRYHFSAAVRTFHRDFPFPNQSRPYFPSLR